MCTTSKYLITAGSDGTLKLFNWVEEGSSLPLLSLIRSIDILIWSYPNVFQNKNIPRQIVSIHLVYSDNSADNDGGIMVLGTSYGEAVVLKCGSGLL